MRQNRESGPRRGSLIQYALDDIKRESFDVIRRELRSTLKGNAGVYALYKGDKLVRVGLARDIYNRLKHHSKDKKLKWNKASLFILKKVTYLKDLETAIVRIARPKYNDQKGRVKDEHFLKRFLRKQVRMKQRKLKKERHKKDKEIRGIQRDIDKIRKVVG